MSPIMRLLLLVALAALPAAHGLLKVGFYKNSCPNAETLVQQAVAHAVANNSGLAPRLIHMHFHDCFVRGCDASVLLEGNDTERTAPPNNPSLRGGFEVVNAVKTALEFACPGIVSCADILAFAARDSAALAGNITWQVPAGRRDGNVSKADEAVNNLPRSDFNSSQLISNFAVKNLTAIEMVTLSGAHSIGRAHCDTVTNRLYNFSNTGGIDPTLSSAYADLLRAKCPENITLASNITVSLDILTPTVLDNRYYLGLENNVGLLTSDHALMTDPTLRSAVRNNSGNGAAWAELFRQAMIKMGNIEVKEGTQGEIRRKCSVVNSRISSTSGLDDNRYLASS